MTAFLGIPGGWEIWVILLIALLLFGHRIPGMARSLGSGIVEFKKGLKSGAGDAKTDTPSQPDTPSQAAPPSHAAPPSQAAPPAQTPPGQATGQASPEDPGSASGTGSASGSAGN